MNNSGYSISSTLNDVINMAMAYKREKNIELVVDCDAGIPNALLGDEKKLRRIIMKLVDNAIKFTEEGYVSIRVGYRRENYGISLLVTIKDTGIGMDEASLEKLFIRFSQADAGRNRQVGGIGLGLTISNALIKAMDGAITVKSKPGKGTTVQIAVPQKVLDETPMAYICDSEQLNVAIYLDMEQFAMVATRDAYSEMVKHILEQLKVKGHICRNFAQLQRLSEGEILTHIFTGVPEYCANQADFDALSLKVKVVVALDPQDEKLITNSGLLKIYKPFHILTIASVLNAADGQKIPNQKFVTKDAHVLVVDDNHMNIRVIEGLLANYKINVTTAASGQEALQKIDTADYDFVFMDHMMTEMDGVETLHRIRCKVGIYFQKVPVIALTANAVAGTREMFLAEGFSDFLEKPVERSVLERVLKRHLPEEKLVNMEELPMTKSIIEKKIQIDDYSSADEVTADEVTADEATAGEVTADGVTADEKMLPGLSQLEQEFEPMGIDVRKGVLYCNGVEGYLDVLQGYCDELDDLDVRAERLFEQGDWNDYIITVHGIKGAMRSIGATAVSEQAEKIEFAGKEGRWEFVRDAHPMLMEEYRKLFASLRGSKWIKGLTPKDEEEEPLSEGIPLSQEEFDAIIRDMEDAMYSLDSDRLLEMVTGLQSLQYRNTSLKELLTPVKKKIEMSDCMSAVELTIRLKKQLESKER